MPTWKAGANANKWSQPASPPPPLFVGKAERNFVKQINDEVIERIIGQQVLYFSLDMDKTDYHTLYGEAIKKTFLPPVRVYTLVEFNGSDRVQQQYGFDNLYNITIHFHKRRLTADQNLFVRLGDFVQYDGMYFAGDGAKYDDDGYFWLLGRVDDVMNISGHRISTAEVESALVAHESVAEAAVIGRADEISGEAIAAFVTLIGGFEGNDELITTLRQHVSDKIGPIAKPKSIVITNDLPKTRSGKIMRRLLKDISEERKLGDVTTLANADIVSELQTRSSESADE